MSPRKEHEKIKSLLGAMIVAYCEEREIEIETVASTTFRRRDLERGFEADESYYIQLADVMRTREDIDLSVDPPPELVVEIEITRSAIAKLELFALMGVPEVWRHDGASLHMFRLNDGEYAVISKSVALPGFPADLVESLLTERFNQGVTSLIRQFRKALA